MSLSLQIEAVHRRLALLRQAAADSAQPELLEAAFQELNLVLEELRTAEEELQHQNQTLLQVQLALSQEQRRYRDLFDLAPDGYLVIDHRGIIQAANQAIVTMLKVFPTPLVGKPMVLFVAPEARSTFQQKLQQLNQRPDPQPHSLQDWSVRLCPRRSAPLDVAITCSAMYAADGTVSSWLWLVRDLTPQKQVEAMRKLAFYDVLTGLPNRALFDDRLPQALALARRRQEKVAVVFLDIDRYKAINDTFGHGVGDRVLQELAHRIQSCLRMQDTAARWGGDEFTLILNPVDSAQAAAQVVERIITSLQPPFEIMENQPLQVDISFGIALFPQDSDDPATLLQYADIALYRAKTEGGGYQFYTPRRGDGGESRLFDRSPLSHHSK